MDSRNNRLVKPGTATTVGRPNARSQNRNASRGGRKNSRAPAEGNAYTGSTTATAAGTSGKGEMSVRTIDVQQNNAGFKNMPMGRTSENFNPAPA